MQESTLHHHPERPYRQNMFPDFAVSQTVSPAELSINSTRPWRCSLYPTCPPTAHTLRLADNQNKRSHRETIERRACVWRSMSDQTKRDETKQEEAQHEEPRHAHRNQNTVSWSLHHNLRPRDHLNLSRCRLNPSDQQAKHDQSSLEIYPHRYVLALGTVIDKNTT